MGCNCKDLEGFDLVLFKARDYENKTQKTAAIFVINDIPSFTDKDNISKINSICCYYTTDGKEHKITKKKTAPKKKATTKKQKKTVDASDVDFTK